MDFGLEAKRHLDQAYRDYEEAKDFEKALAECDLAIQIDPFVAEAHNLRGIVLEELGHVFEAHKAYKEALHLAPDFAEARENLSDLQAELSRPRRLATIATFSHAPQAHILRSKLEAEGIWAFVADAETVTMNWLYSNAIGGVKLQVAEEDVEEALAILAREPEPIEQDEDEAEPDAAKCRECSSTDVTYEKYATRLFFLSWLVLNVPIPFLRKRWTCRTCGHSWRQ